MLTRKQRELLLFISAHQADTGVTPSFDEMARGLGLASKSGVHRLISGLEERGYVRRLPHRARAIDVVRMPPDLANKPSSPLLSYLGPGRHVVVPVGDVTLRGVEIDGDVLIVSEGGFEGSEAGRSDAPILAREGNGIAVLPGSAVSSVLASGSAIGRVVATMRMCRAAA